MKYTGVYKGKSCWPNYWRGLCSRDCWQILHAEVTVGAKRQAIIIGIQWLKFSYNHQIWVEYEEPTPYTRLGQPFPKAGTSLLRLI